MIIHPSLIEKASLDAREYNADVAADIKRSFAYVGPVTAVSHEAGAGDAPVCNEMRLICRMNKPYWTSEGEGDAMWASMHAWLEAKAYKVESTIANFNKSRSEAGRQTVDYDRIELDMKPYAFGIACCEGDKLPELAGIAQRVRELLAQGVLPADMAGIEAPSAASLAEQARVAREQAAAAKAQAEAEAEAAAKAAEAAQEQAADEGGADQAETDATGSSLPADASEPAEAEGAQDAEPAESEAPARLPHASDCLASLDYTLWDVRLADGSVRTLDSVAGTWA